jgi:hypothetical protein
LIQERWHFARTFGRAPFHHLIRDSSSSFILTAHNPVDVLPHESPLRVPQTQAAFIRAHNETVSVVAMCVSNPGHSPFAMQS